MRFTRSVWLPSAYFATLAEKGVTFYIHKVTKAIIKPGMEKKFWAVLQGPANFFKHADRDADAILDDVDEEVNDIAMLLTCHYYQNLGYQLTPEMMILMFWVNVMHPNYLREDIQVLMKEELSNARRWLVGQSRQESAFVMQATSAGIFKNLTNRVMP